MAAELLNSVVYILNMKFYMEGEEPTIPETPETTVETPTEEGTTKEGE